MLTSITAVAVASIASGIFFTWLGRMFAHRVGLMDCPDGRRKIHAKPIAVIGGIALLFAASTTLFVAYLTSDTLRYEINNNWQPIVSLFFAATVIAFVGMVDDIFNLRARYKLAGQLTAIAVLIFAGGFLIDQISIFGHAIHFEWFAYPFTVLWFLAAINALNLLDGMDGMLGTIGTLILVSIGIMAFSFQRNIDGFVAIAIAGALIGFLRFNLPPATVYLGDCGSMLIGLTIAALAIHASIKGPAVAIMVPTTLLVLPFLDTAAAIVRRKLTGRGIAAADRGHLHHMLQKRGLATRRALVLVFSLCVLASLGALASVYFQNDLAAVAAAMVIGLILVSGGLFGAVELRLIRERLRSFLRHARGQSAGVEMEVRLQGTADWTRVWHKITYSAEELNFTSITLDVNAPSLHEGYIRRWNRVGASENPLTVWRVELPLYGFGQGIGRLTVCGSREDESLNETLQALAQILAQAEALATEVASQAELDIRSGIRSAEAEATLTATA